MNEHPATPLAAASNASTIEPNAAPGAGLPVSPNSADTSASARVSPFLYHRWWIPVGEVTLAILAQLALGVVLAENGTLQGMLMYALWPGTVLAVLIWWVTLSRYRWSTRGYGLLGVAALVVTFLTLFRLDETDGNMLPTNWSFRFSPDRATRAREYFANATARQKSLETNTAAAKQALADDQPSGEPAVSTSAALPALELGPRDWPGYRGYRREGIVQGIQISPDWSAQPPTELWRHPVGEGWSSFAAVGDLAYTQEQRDAEECTVCYNSLTGEQVWVHAEPTRFDAAVPMGGPGPRATPLFDGGHLYSLGATGTLLALDSRSGQLIWKRNILADAGAEGGPPATNLEWGMTGSPWIEEGVLYCAPGGTAGKSVIAYDAKTGDIKWAAGQHPASYHAPRTYTLLGVPQLLVFHGDGLASYSLEGKPLWFHAWTNQPKVNVAQPIAVGEGDLVLGNGYGVGSARISLARDGDTWTVTTKWETNKLKPKFNDMIFKDGYVYGLDDGILTCLDVETGKPKWKKGRYKYGQLLLAGSHLLVLSEDGAIVLVDATPEAFREVASQQVLPEGITWNHPAIAADRLLVRNGREAACYRLPMVPAQTQTASVAP